MAIKIRLDCKKAFEKLKDTGYRFHVPMRAVKIYIANDTHVDVNGRSISMRKLAALLIRGDPGHNMPPRPFVTDAGRELNAQLRALIAECSYVRKRNTKNPNYVADIYIDFDADTLCTKATALIKNWIVGGYYCAVAPNAEKTIQNKGFNLPLVETGQLVNSISAKVVFGRGAY